MTTMTTMSYNHDHDYHDANDHDYHDANDHDYHDDHYHNDHDDHDDQLTLSKLEVI